MTGSINSNIAILAKMKTVPVVHVSRDFVSSKDEKSSPKLVWATRRDSAQFIHNPYNLNFGSKTSVNDNLLGNIRVLGTETPKSGSVLSRQSRNSITSIGGDKVYFGKRYRKKKDAEVYKAEKQRHQKKEMVAYYRGTPIVDHNAKPNDILIFLYKLWEPQICSSYRKTAQVKTNSRQDLRNSRKLAQTTSARLLRIQKAKMTIEVNPSVNCETPQSASRTSSRRSSSLQRPRSSMSVI